MPKGACLGTLEPVRLCLQKSGSGEANVPFFSDFRFGICEMFCWYGGCGKWTYSTGEMRICTMYRLLMRLMPSGRSEMEISAEMMKESRH